MRKGIGVLLASALAAFACAQQMRVATMEATAFYGDAMKGALKEAGIDAAIVVMSQEDMIAGLAKGTIDGAFFLAEPLIVQAKGAVKVPVQLAFTDFCAVTLDPSVKIANPGDLRKYSVGVTKGNVAHGAVTRGMKTVEAENDLELFKLLASGKAQAIISVDKAAPGLAKAAGLAAYTLQTPPLLRSPPFLALSKASEGKQGAIDSALKTLVANGQGAKASAAAEAGSQGAAPR